MMFLRNDIISGMIFKMIIKTSPNLKLFKHAVILNFHVFLNPN